MKVKELIELLNTCDPETEIMVVEQLPHRRFGGRMRAVQEVTIVYDQDTNKPRYVIEIREDRGRIIHEQYYSVSD